ncbi:hypothetical protein, partial [Mycolicibacterium hassiacum]|uniref:hypothetical protein n=1 Tax=Mycolicibacterium hassiacum TaxID=46351 RepID=UPI0023F6C508
MALPGFSVVSPAVPARVDVSDCAPRRTTGRYRTNPLLWENFRPCGRRAAAVESPVPVVSPVAVSPGFGSPDGAVPAPGPDRPVLDVSDGLPAEW